jgi:hypothetical protein
VFDSPLVFSYIIGIYDLDIVQGGFNIFKETQYAQSAIAFPVVSIVAGVILFIVGKFARCVALEKSRPRCGSDFSLQLYRPYCHLFRLGFLRRSKTCDMLKSFKIT